MPTYTVTSGDSAARVAGKIYGDQRMFAKLKALNPGAWYPGRVLVLPKKDKDPFVSRESFEAARAGQPVGAGTQAGISGAASALARDLAGARKIDYGSAFAKERELTAPMTPGELAQVRAKRAQSIYRQGEVAKGDTRLAERARMANILDVSRTGHIPGVRAGSPLAQAAAELGRIGRTPMGEPVRRPEMPLGPLGAVGAAAEAAFGATVRENAAARPRVSIAAANQPTSFDLRVQAAADQTERDIRGIGLRPGSPLASVASSVGGVLQAAKMSRDNYRDFMATGRRPGDPVSPEEAKAKAAVSATAGLNDNLNPAQLADASRWTGQAMVYAGAYTDLNMDAPGKAKAPDIYRQPKDMSIDVASQIFSTFNNPLTGKPFLSAQAFLEAYRYAPIDADGRKWTLMLPGGGGGYAAPSYYPSGGGGRGGRGGGGGRGLTDWSWAIRIT